MTKNRIFLNCHIARDGIKGILLFLCLLFWGCSPGPIFSWVVDISREKNLWGGYDLGDVYRLKKNVFLVISKDPPEVEQVALVPPRMATAGNHMLLYHAPKTLSDYKKNEDQWPEVAGIIHKNTKIKCIRLLKYMPMAYESSIYIQARILDGPFAGKEVEISDLSISKLDKNSNLYLLSPNPKLLSFEGAS